MNQTRKDYEHCILIPKEFGGYLYSICGKEPWSEFYFTSIRHWLDNRKNEGRLIGCRQCLAVIKEAIEMEEE